MSTLQDAETVGDGYRVKVLDAERLDVFILMIYRHLEQITILALQEEEEASLCRTSAYNPLDRRKYAP